MFNINNYEYILYLCKMDKSQICIIPYLDISINKNFQQFSELSFEVSYYENGWIQVENKTFNLFQPNYIILLETRNNDEVIDAEYFIINQSSLKYDNGEVKKNIQCYSSESIFNNRYLTTFEEVRVLYDPNNNYNINDNTKGGILNYILESMRSIWKIDYISPSLLGIYHSFKYSSQTYRSVIEDLQSVYNCIFIFNTTTNKINIYTSDEIGEDTEIILSDENFIKSLNCDKKNNEFCTSLRVYGKDNITISEHNPTGLPYLYDFSYFLNNGYLSSSLSSALTIYNNLIISKEGEFSGYLSNLNTLRTTLLTKQNELNDLNITLKTIEDSLDVLIDNNRRNTDEYDDIYENKISVLDLINSKEEQIDMVQSQIDNILNNIKNLNTLLSLENNFTEEQLTELGYYISEGTPLKLDSVDNSELLYQYAKQYMKIKSTPPYDFSIDLIDLFSIDNQYIENRYKKIKVGNYIYIDCPRLGFNYDKYRIIQISHNKLSNSLSIIISNKDKINTDLYYLEKILVEAPKEIDSLKINKEDYSKYIKESNKILYNDSIINTDNNPIVVGTNYIDKRGFQGNSLGTRNGAIKIQGDQIVFSPDGDFKTYYAILSSSGLYFEDENKNSEIWITPETGFSLNVFNSELNDYRNAIYLGQDTNQNPCLCIDNGYINLTYRQNGANINEIKLNPEVGIAISKWDNNLSNWRPVFFTTSNGGIIANELIANNAVIQGKFMTGFVGSARIEMSENGITSYNTNERKHGLKVSVGSFTDFSLYNNDSPQFLIYDDLTVIDMYAILGDYDPENPLKNNISDYSSRRFLATSGSVTTPRNTWNFSNATVTNLDGYATESYVDENFATRLSWNSSLRILSLLNDDGDVLSSVIIT